MIEPGPGTHLPVPPGAAPSAPPDVLERDAHLRAALRHAPDAATPVPPLLKARIVAAALREAQAARAAAPWHRRWVEILRHPWRLGGVGTLAAAMLAATVLWVGRDETPTAAAPEVMLERPAEPAVAGNSATTPSTAAGPAAAAATVTEAANSPSAQPAAAVAPATGASPAPLSAAARPAKPPDRARSADGVGTAAPGGADASERRAAPPPRREADTTRADAGLNAARGTPPATPGAMAQATSEAAERLATPAQSAARATTPMPATRDARAGAAAAPAAAADTAVTAQAPTPPHAAGPPAAAPSPFPPTAPARVAAAPRATAAEGARAPGATPLAAASPAMAERWQALGGPWQWRAPDGAAGELPSAWLTELAAATASRWRAAPGTAEATAAADGGVALMQGGVVQGRVGWSSGTVSACDAAGRCEIAPLDAAAWQALRARLGPR